MAYQYTHFEDVPLPLYNHNQDHQPMPSESALFEATGGFFDWWGTERRKGRRQLISFTGVYLGQVEYLADETGDLLTDDTGDLLILGDNETMLAAQVRALMEKKGIRGQLWRIRLLDDVREWKTARLLQVSWPRKYSDHAVIAEVTPRFETIMEYWHAATATTVTGDATDGVTILLPVENSGETIDDAVLTIECTDGEISAVSLMCAELGIGWTWEGDLWPDDVLVIDAGSNSVIPDDAEAAFSGFTLTGSSPGFMTIEQGSWVFALTVTGGEADVELSYYIQVP